MTRAWPCVASVLLLGCGAPPASETHSAAPPPTIAAPPMTATPTPPPPPPTPAIDEARRCGDASDCVYIAGRCGMLEASRRDHVPALEVTTGNPVEGCPMWLPDQDPTRGPFRLECREGACTVVIDDHGTTECTHDADCVAVDEGCSWGIASTTAPNYHPPVREPSPAPPCIMPVQPVVTCFRDFCVDRRSLSAPLAPTASPSRPHRAR